MTKKKLTSIVIIGISLIIAAVVLVTHKSDIAVTHSADLYIDDAAYESIVTSRMPSELPLTINISFDGQSLIYDSDTNSFYYSVVENSDTAFCPEVLTDEGLTVSLHGPEISPEIIAANQPIEIVIYNKESFSIANLVCTTLPVMNVAIDEATVAEQGLDDTFDIISYTGSTVYVFDNRADFDDVSRTTISDAKIRRHGQSTAGYPLKGYRFSLLSDKNDFEGEKRKENLLGLRKDDDWVLSASYRDYEKVRNVFSMNLWYESCTDHNQWRVNNSTQYKYIELFFNGHYHGLYALCYRIDAKELGTGEGESTFKKKDWTMSEYDLDLTYEEYPDGSGGAYVLPGYSIKDGDAADYNTLLQLYINMNYSPDPNVVRMTTDMDNAIDLWLLYKLTQAVDNVYGGNVKNMYVTIKNSDQGIEGHELLFTPWDMDQTWRYVSEAAEGQYSRPDYDLPLEWGTVYRLIAIGDATINSEIKERYQELRADAWSDENILAMLDEYEADIYGSGAFARTQAKYMAGSYNDPSVGLSEFKSYVLARLACMDAYIGAL